MPTLKQIRENNEKKKNFINNRDYKFPSSLSIASKIIKNQNILLINKICDIKKVSKGEREELLKMFIKVNYYCPSVTKYQKIQDKQLDNIKII